MNCVFSNDGDSFRCILMIERLRTRLLQRLVELVFMLKGFPFNDKVLNISLAAVDFLSGRLNVNLHQYPAYAIRAKV